MRFKTITLTLLLLALIPGAAAAGTGQLALFQDDDGLVNGGAGRRAATVSELQALGVDAVKIQLNWAEVAPRTKKKPAGFDGSDPADYPGWTKFDDAVRAAQNGGFRVMIALSPPVPGWATARRGDRSGVDRPSAKEYARFAEAAGRRYPSVDLWTLWNEPNHPGFLYPQASRSRVPYSPRLYRSLIKAGTTGLARAGHGGDRILFGSCCRSARHACSARTRCSRSSSCASSSASTRAGARTAGARPPPMAAGATARSPG